MRLQLRGLSLPLAEFALTLDLEITHPAAGLFGPSGAGKTSLLDLIAGLRRPQTAFLQLDDTIFIDTSRGIFVPARRRGIGYVAQDGALFPHLSVRGNLLYGARRSNGGLPALPHIAEILEIAALLDRRIGDLSGGEKQRVACARALLAEPRLLLLDEPLSGLNDALREKTQQLLLRMRREFQIPILFVSHRAEEMVALCDEIIVLERGKCVQQGSAAEVFVEKNATAFHLRQPHFSRGQRCSGKQ